jgi:hypothetical protein
LKPVPASRFSTENYMYRTPPSTSNGGMMC